MFPNVSTTIGSSNKAYMLSTPKRGIAFIKRYFVKDFQLSTFISLNNVPYSRKILQPIHK